MILSQYYLLFSPVRKVLNGVVLKKNQNKEVGDQYCTMYVWINIIRCIRLYVIMLYVIMCFRFYVSFLFMFYKNV